MPRKVPETSAASAIVIDFDTGSIIYEKRADTSCPPASLTKIISLSYIQSLIAEGVIDRDDSIAAEPSRWPILGPLASKIGITAGTEITVQECITAAAAVSANDAMYALAVHCAGAEKRFVKDIRKYLAGMKFNKIHIYDSCGFSAKNRITARSFAYFARDYIRNFPECLKHHHGIQQIYRPGVESALNQREIKNSRRVFVNQNPLIGKYPGADGLKTGYIRASGFNICATAKRNGRRIIAVLLGIPGNSIAQGKEGQYREARKVLDYAFRSY